MGRGARQLARRARAGRRRGRHHAVELPAVPDRAQGRPGAGRRLHRRAQAERGGADQRLHPGRGHRRGRPARRRLQPGERRRAGRRRGHRRPPQGRHGLLHRLDPGRPAGHGAGRRGHQAGVARARRQVGQHPARRRRLRRRRAGRGVRLLHELGPDLLGPDPHARPPGQAGRGGGAGGGRRGRLRPRRPLRGRASSSGRSSPRSSATGSAATSTRASRRGPSWSSAAPRRPRGWRRASSSSRPSSPT